MFCFFFFFSSQHIKMSRTRRQAEYKPSVLGRIHLPCVYRGVLQGGVAWRLGIAVLASYIRTSNKWIQKKTRIGTYNLRFMRCSCRTVRESRWLYWNLNVVAVTETLGKHLLFNSSAATFEENFVRCV